MLGCIKNACSYINTCDMIPEMIISFFFFSFSFRGPYLYQADPYSICKRTTSRSTNSPGFALCVPDCQTARVSNPSTEEQDPDQSVTERESRYMTTLVLSANLSVRGETDSTPYTDYIVYM